MDDHQDPDPGFEEKATRVIPLRMDNLIGALRKRSVVKSLLGFECRFCGYEDLLAMKKAAGRPQDLIDIEGLRRARH